MSTIRKLEKLQDYMSILEQNNKIIKNASYLYLLKKMKKNYEKAKELYLKNKEKLQKLKDEYEKVSKDLKKLKKSITEDNEYYNVTTRKSKDKDEKEIKTRISSLERRGDELLIKSEELIETIEELRIKLINDKNNYTSFKEKVDCEVSSARKKIEDISVLIQDLKKEMPEYLFNMFISKYKASGIGIVKSKNGLCSNCKNNIIEYVNTESIGDVEIVSCPSCGGVLYVYNVKKQVISKISV